MIHVGCTCWLYMLVVHVGCTCWLYMLVVHVGCTCWVYLSGVLVGCTCRLYLFCSFPDNHMNMHVRITVLHACVCFLRVGCMFESKDHVRRVGEPLKFYNPDAFCFDFQAREPTPPPCWSSCTICAKSRGGRWSKKRTRRKSGKAKLSTFVCLFVALMYAG